MLVHRSISVLSTSKFPFQPNIISLLKTNYPSLVLFSNPCSKFCSLKSRAFATTLAAATSVSDADTFLAEEGVTWAALGVSDSITRALCNVGLHRPSLVQAASIPTILSGTDVVVAAETGSGKTHGYLVPLLHKLQIKMNMPENPVDDVIRPRKHRDVSLVLCPNVMLCEQVVRMANSLCDESGIPLVKTAAICGRQELSFKEPDIIVSTPVALLNYLFAIDPEKRRRDNFIRGVKYVVFDEADLLLCGSFQNQVIRLINMLRFDEKQLSRMQAADTGVNDTESSSVKVSDAEEDDVKYDPTEEDGEDEDEDPNNRFLVEEPENESEIRGRKDWRRFRKAYKRSKQYVFIAATLPVNGKQTAGGILKRLFPEANWVSGNYLHQHNPRLEHKWIEVTADTQVDALISAVKSGLNIKTDDSNPIVRTMVFANTVEAVEAIGKILTGAGITCMRYHSNMSLEERTKNLFDFQLRGGVFVCTGAAARGLDVPHISHVIQAEFASCAVDFLHRVGRTARAGRHGLVTSLFTESNRDLVHAVRRAEQLGLPVEKAFSRKRSFRKKLKKRARDSTSSVREQVSA